MKMMILCSVPDSKRKKNLRDIALVGVYHAGQLQSGTELDLDKVAEDLNKKKGASAAYWSINTCLHIK